MDSFLGRIKDAADQVSANASVAQEKVIQEYLPKIIDILREKGGSALLEIISDIDRLTELARSAYQALPMPVRIVVKEQSFVDWVVSHQDSVIENVRSQLSLEHSTQEESPAALPSGHVDGDCATGSNEKVE